MFDHELDLLATSGSAHLKIGLIWVDVDEFVVDDSCHIAKMFGVRSFARTRSAYLEGLGCVVTISEPWLIVSDTGQ